jgi:ABC-type uncharacterized transport system permease subunit
MNTAITLATAIAGLVSPALTQVVKQYIPAAWRPTFAATVAVALGCLALWATGGFSHTTWALALAAVVGVSQALYAVIDKIVDGSKAAAAAKTATTDTASEATPTA